MIEPKRFNHNVALICFGGGHDLEYTAPNVQYVRAPTSPYGGTRKLREGSKA